MPEKAPNPFHPNSVVTHNLFAGRTTQVNHVLGKVSLIKSGIPSSFFFIGERGIGKTALSSLVMYASKTKDKDFYNLNLLSAYYSVVKGQSVGEVLQAVLNELSDELPNHVLTSLAGRLGNLLQNGKFSIGAFGGSISLESTAKKSEPDVIIRDQVVSILSNLISTIRGGRAASKDGILLVLDEVNNLSNLKDCAQLIRGIVTTLNVKGKGNISFILIGYDETEKVFFSGDESARRHFDEVRLGPMPADEAEDILRKGFRSVGTTFSEPALKANIEAAGGFPHSIQLLGHNLYDIDIDGNIGSDDWAEALRMTAIEMQTKEFANLYNFHGKKRHQELLLDILVNQQEPVSKSELANMCPESLNIYVLIPRLKEEGSIAEDLEGKVTISSHLLRVAIILAQLQRRPVL